MIDRLRRRPTIDRTLIIDHNLLPAGNQNSLELGWQIDARTDSTAASIGWSQKLPKSANTDMSSDYRPNMLRYDNRARIEIKLLRSFCQPN